MVNMGWLSIWSLSNFKLCFHEDEKTKARVTFMSEVFPACVRIMLMTELTQHFETDTSVVVP